jgi:hypothetical protein
MKKHLKNRKGAILVMTGIMLLVLIAIAAIAMDTSRLHAARNELRTAADAAALAGAQRLLTDPTTAETQAKTLATKNRALSEAVTVQQVRYGIWDPIQREFVPTSQVAADAIEVTVTHATKPMLPSVFGKGDVNLTAKAIAWSGAPVDGVKCVKPFAMLHEDFMVALGKKHWADLTQDDIQKLRDTSGTNKKWFTLNMGNSYSSPARGNWYAVQLPAAKVDGKVVNDGSKSLPLDEAIATCNKLKAGDMVITEPGKKVGLVEQGMDRLCANLIDGKCYNAEGTIGVPVAVAIFCTGPELTGGGHMWLETHYVAAFMLTDFVKGGTDAGSVRGFFIGMQGEGKVSNNPSPVTKTILVG